jgi:hypothetical protein
VATDSETLAFPKYDKCYDIFIGPVRNVESLAEEMIVETV